MPDISESENSGREALFLPRLEDTRSIIREMQKT